MIGPGSGYGLTSASGSHMARRMIGGTPQPQKRRTGVSALMPNCPCYTTSPPRWYRASVRRHRRTFRGCLWPCGGWIGSHAAAPCWLLNDCYLRLVNAHLRRLRGRAVLSRGKGGAGCGIRGQVRRQSRCPAVMVGPLLPNRGASRRLVPLIPHGDEHFGSLRKPDAGRQDDDPALDRPPTDHDASSARRTGRTPFFAGAATSNRLVQSLVGSSTSSRSREIEPGRSAGDRRLRSFATRPAPAGPTVDRPNRLDPARSGRGRRR
jgi:hypothetical protein